MDYTPPTLCIRSVVESETPGMFVIDMQSIWRSSPTYTVDKETIDYVTERVVKCPPGWPNTPSK